ncbi:MAG: RIP metalloprotease RseP [Gammaproteobacteria bacterium]|nr:RIP metalloprotease RseP [Gammaproteobacteria bacterium]
MLALLIALFSILFTIFFVIGTHEAAHFMVARLFGVKVLRFSIGFGKRLWHGYDKSGTEYVIALIPLGGYVKMLDENEASVSSELQHAAYNRQPYYKKFFIVLAGPASNLLCAFVLYWLIFIIGFTAIKPIIGEIKPGSIAEQSGLQAQQQFVAINEQPTKTWARVMFRLLEHLGNETKLSIVVSDRQLPTVGQTKILDLTHWKINPLIPDPLESLGIKPYAPLVPLVIGLIKTNSPANTSDLRVGDKIIAIDKKPVQEWGEVMKTIAQNPNEKILFTIERSGKLKELPVIIGSQRSWTWKQSGYLGIAPFIEIPQNLLHKIQYGPLAAAGYAYQEVLDLTYFNLLLFGKMLTGKISLQSLGGPITIFESAGNALNYGFISFLAFLAFLSISIGVINLLPIPGLDGGHLLFQTIEAIMGKPLPIKVLELCYRLGFLFLFFILFQSLINDFLRM